MWPTHRQGEERKSVGERTANPRTQSVWPTHRQGEERKSVGERTANPRTQSVWPADRTRHHPDVSLSDVSPPDVSPSDATDWALLDLVPVQSQI